MFANGVVETHYSNGQLRTRETFKNDKLEGLCETWHENGQLESRVNYKD